MRYIALKKYFTQGGKENKAQYFTLGFGSAPLREKKY
jgi:hypothetical protein